MTTDTITVDRRLIENLCDVLRERRDHLQEYSAFLFELEGDLDDWVRTLTRHIGGDAEQSPTV